MPSTVEAEETIQVGQEIVVASGSPTTEFEVVFEDDGTTGYFYGVDTSSKEIQILDAMHIYNVASVVDKDSPSLVQVAWSGDGLKAALFINGFAHAVFDFAVKRGYCRTNFPSPSGTGEWTTFDHKWSDSALDLFG
jgi:hypothetical protein